MRRIVSIFAALPIMATLVAVMSAAPAGAKVNCMDLPNGYQCAGGAGSPSQGSSPGGGGALYTWTGEGRTLTSWAGGGGGLANPDGPGDGGERCTLNEESGLDECVGPHAGT